MTFGLTPRDQVAQPSLLAILREGFVGGRSFGSSKAVDRMQAKYFVSRAAVSLFFFRE